MKRSVYGIADVYQLDIDKNEELYENLNVGGVPTFILYQDGQETWRQSGQISAEALVAKIKGE